MDDLSFKIILQFFGLSWQGYRKVRKGVKKRLSRHMQEVGARSIDAYLHQLQRDPDAMGKAEELLTVSISRFFRDAGLWEAMRSSILPKLAAWPGREVRIWSAGCACGEEVYSVKILWDQARKSKPGMPTLQITATDMNPTVLEKARAGIYSYSSLRSTDPGTRDEYFIRTREGFTVREDLKKGISWMMHDFVRDPPPAGNFDCIFLRNNLLTYYNPPIRTPAFRRVVEALKIGGYIVIGNNEQAPSEAANIRRSPEYRCILERIG